MLITLSSFILFATRNGKSDSDDEGEEDSDGRLRMRTAVQLQKHLWYWCGERKLAAGCPPATEFFRRTTEVLQFVKSSGGFNLEPKNKTYLGLNELIQLIDYDVSREVRSHTGSSNYFLDVIYP
jgi:hypothetical protein